MIKTDMLRAFAAVARAGNLLDGAAAINRTPSAVSMTLKSLEEHLGQPLFEPGRKNRLTPLGAFTLEVAERELQHFAKTVRSLEDFAGAQTGEVRIAAVPSFASAALPEIVLEFQRRHSAIRLDIRDMDSASIWRALEREQIDLGIVSDAKPHPDFERTQLSEDIFGLVVRDDHRYAGKSSLAWKSIEPMPMIVNPLCEPIDVPHLQLALSRAKLRVHNTTTLLAMVRARLGVTTLPQLIFGMGLPGLSFVPIERPFVWRRLHLLVRKRDTLSPAAAKFAALLLSSNIVPLCQTENP